MGPALALAALVVLGVAGPAAAPSASVPQAQGGSWVSRFESRPDLRPPAVVVRRRGPGRGEGLLFLGSILGPGQRGPLVVDDRGEVVWFKRLPRGVVATDVRVQTYLGRPVLTWWQGRYRSGHGCGVGVIADTSYRTIATVGRCADLHEFRLTPRGTALMLDYPVVRRGGRRLYDGVVQEVDVRSGRVLFRWSAAQHVAFAESYVRRPLRPGRPIDFFHVNAVDEDAQGDLLVTARHTWGVYKVDRSTGRVLWRLGGKRSGFAVPRTGRFSWPHDARFLADGSISLFDNAAGDVATGPQRESSVMVFGVDEAARRVTLVRRHTHAPRIRSLSQANAQLLPNRNFLVGWGFVPYVSEHAPDGRQVLDLRLPPRSGTYRAYRFPWTGRPAGRPSLAVRRRVAYVSWNGATEVARWQVLAGRSPRSLRPVAEVARRGFETAARLPAGVRWVSARALDGSRHVLGRSMTFAVG